MPCASASGRSSAPTSRIFGSARTARASARPMRPPAPATTTRSSAMLATPRPNSIPARERARFRAYSNRGRPTKPRRSPDSRRRKGYEGGMELTLRGRTEEHGWSGRRLKLSTLIRLRWLAVGGQTAAILVVGLWFGFPLPMGACFALIALSAWLNLGLRLVFPPAYRLDPNWAALLLAYDLAAACRPALPDRRTGEPVRDPAACARHGLGDDAAAGQDLPDRRDDARRRDGARLHPPAAAVVSGRRLRRAAPLCRRRLGGARLRARLHGLLRLPRGGGGAAPRRRARRDGAGAAARAASLRARRARRRRRARARHAARHDRARRARACERDSSPTIRMRRTSG